MKCERYSRTGRPPYEAVEIMGQEVYFTQRPWVFLLTMLTKRGIRVFVEGKEYG